MLFSFDGFDRYEMPILTLAYPNFDEIAIIKDPIVLKGSLRFSSVSELTLNLSYNEATAHYYEDIQKECLIHVQNIGWFVISTVSESIVSKVKRKEIKCKSYDATLTHKPVDLDAGTYNFYDFASPETSLLGIVFSNSPNWNLEYISPQLIGKYRTFELPDTSIYSFLTNEVTEAYECIFVFDIENRTVSAHTHDELIKDSGVMMRFDTILKEVQIADTADKPVTALSVYGAGDFSIRDVNPLGTPTIYKFDYFKDWMSPELWNAIEAWQAEIDIQTPQYATLLSDLKQGNADYATQKSDFAKMDAILKSAQQVQDVSIPYTLQGSSNSAVTSMKSWVNSQTVSYLNDLILNATGYPAISFSTPPSAIQSYVNAVAVADRGIAQALINIAACEKVMAAQEVAMTAQEDSIASIRSQMVDIHSFLAFTEWFTEDQLKELDVYIFGADFTNEYCVTVDSMTFTEVQDIAMELLEQGKSMLDRLSQPSFTFTLQCINYLFNKEFETYIRDTELGYLIHAEIEEGDWVTPILLEVNLNWSDPDDFSMKFGNRFRLQENEYLWADLMEDVQKTTNAVSSEFSTLIAPQRNGTIDAITDLMNNAWDAAKNAVIAGTDQSMTIDEHGITGRKLLQSVGRSATDVYSPEQFKMINNLLAFTDDGWQNCKLALGKIDIGGSTAYGLVAEAVFGTLVAGNNLVFTNESGSFKFDGSGATLNDANLTITRSNGNARILMNAADGFKIQKKSGESWTDQVYIDTNGNAIFAGNISGATISGGTISGTSIVGGSINIGNGNFTVNSAGNVYAGSGTFNGTVYATGGEFRGTVIANSFSTFDGSFNSNALSRINTIANTYAQSAAATAQSGAITAITGNFGNLMANNVSAISANIQSITAQTIRATRIDADQINAGTLKGMTIWFGQSSQQGVLQSSGGGSGVQMDAPGGIALSSSQGQISFLSVRDGVHLGGTYISFGTANLRWMNGFNTTGNSTPNVRISQSTGGGMGLFETTSSKRYKKCIEDLPTHAIDDLIKMRPVIYEEKNSDSGEKFYGLIAEEVYEIDPILVDMREYDGVLKPQNVNYMSFIPILIAKVNDLQKQIDDLKCA